MPSVLEQQNAIQAHIRNFFKAEDFKVFSWGLGGIKDSLPFFRVMRLKQGDNWVYVSNGASTIQKGGNYGCEFVLVSPREDPLLVELLAMVAHFQSAPEHRFIDVGNYVKIGRPWLGASACTNLLVSLPYPYGPDLEWLHLDKSQHVRFTWLVPITDDEAKHAAEKGIDALEALFEKTGLAYLDIDRDSVV